MNKIFTKEEEDVGLTEEEIIEFDKRSDHMTEVLYNSWLYKINKNIKD